ncbi:hypothetical protein QUC31_007899 [Theobroma cacao]
MSADENSSSFTIGNFAQEKGLPYVPKCYVVSPSNRSSLDLVPEKAQVPTIDIEVRKLALEIMGTIRESLGIVPNQLGKKMEDGVQVMAVNCYPPCPEPEMALGLPPHSDYTFLTIVLQNSSGLEILDTEDGKWKIVPVLHPCR